MLQRINKWINATGTGGNVYEKIPRKRHTDKMKKEKIITTPILNVGYKR